MISRNGLSAIRCPLSADWYLPTDESLAAFSEILRFAQNDLCGGKESA